MSVVGVDIGYQNSVIAAAGRGGVDVILNGNSNRLNPYVFDGWSGGLVNWLTLPLLFYPQNNGWVR